MFVVLDVEKVSTFNNRNGFEVLLNVKDKPLENEENDVKVREKKGAKNFYLDLDEQLFLYLEIEENLDSNEVVDSLEKEPL